MMHKYQDVDVTPGDVLHVLSGTYRYPVLFKKKGVIQGIFEKMPDGTSVSLARTRYDIPNDWNNVYGIQLKTRKLKNGKIRVYGLGIDLV